MERGSDYPKKNSVSGPVNDEKREKQLGFFSKSVSYFFQTFDHYVVFRLPVFFISGLIYGHSLVKHATLSILIIYITDKWEEPNLAKAAIIINAQEGLSSLLIVFEAHFADSSLRGRFYVVIFSTASMIAGLMLLRETDTDKNLGIFGGVIFLIALGEAGKQPTLKAFLADQLKDEDTKDDHQLPDEEKAKDQLTRGDMENTKEITSHQDVGIDEDTKDDHQLTDEEKAKDQLTRGDMENTKEITSHQETMDNDQMQEKDNTNTLANESSKMENQKKDNTNTVANESSKMENLVVVKESENDEEKLLEDRVNTWWRMFHVLGALSGTFGLPKLDWGETWRRTFLTSAIVMASSLLIFLSGFWLYKYAKPKHSPLKSVFRILRSVFSNGRVKYSNQSVDDHKEMNESDKAAMLVKIPSPTTRQKERKEVSAEEVKEVKKLMRMVPMWATFIMYCVTQATGSTFFFEQTSDLDRKIATSENEYTVPYMTFYLMQSFSSYAVIFLANYVISSKWFQGDERRKMMAYKIRIGLGLGFSCLACVAAMFVEKKRLRLVEGLTGNENEDESINMSVFYLTPQFCLLGLAEGLIEDGVVNFFYYQVADSTKNYGPPFNQFALGLGKFFSIFWILTFKSWIHKTINNSRLDNYYMVLAFVNLGNLLVVYMFVSIYVYKDIRGVQLTWGGFFSTCFERSKTAEEGARMSKPGDSMLNEERGDPKDYGCFSICTS